jgi:hypothetical protein
MYVYVNCVWGRKRDTHPSTNLAYILTSFYYILTVFASILQPFFTSLVMLPYIVLFALLPPLIPAATTGITGGDRLGGSMCPGKARNDTEAILVYTPFTPWWNFAVPFPDFNSCWLIADCLYEAAGESRKQQFSATALVMGLIPPTIKDIAWPERRLVYVTKKLHWVIEILVLALGLVPQITYDIAETKRRGREGALVADWAWRKKNTVRKRVIVISVAVFALILCYGGLVAMEVFSKRSALGCVVPAFIFLWHFIALIPAAIHLLFSRFGWGRMAEKRDGEEGTVRNSVSGDEGSSNGKVASAVQGANEYWPVQMAWGIYYIAGTLIFTSIMAVTVPELTVWVVLGLVTAGCSKVLAQFLCLVSEDTYGKLDSDGEQVVISRQGSGDAGTVPVGGLLNRQST